MEEKKFLKQTGVIAIGITFSLLSLWFLFSKLSLGYSGGPPSGVDIGINSKATQQMNLQPSGTTGTFVTRYGTQGVSGSGTAGYMSGTDTDFPRSEWTPATGKLNFIGVAGFDIMLQIDGIDIPLTGSLSTKLDAVGGVGTGNTFNNPTLAGQGSITATFNANGLDITPAEFASVNNATSELQAQINGKQASLINNSPGTVTNVLGYTPPANVLGSITTALGYTPPANVLGSITASLGYTPVANTQGSITAALGYTPTDLGNSIALGTETTGNTDNISEGNTNKYYTDAKVNTAVGSLSVDALNDVNIISPADGHKLTYDLATGKWIAATSSSSVAFSGVTGSATDNTNFSQTPQANKVKVPVTDNSGKLTWNWLGGITGTATTSIGTTTVNLIVSDPNSILLLHFDSTSGTTTFKNDGYGTMTITAQNGAAISTVQKKFGVSSSLYDGVNDNAVVATSPLFTLAAGSKWDFSVELNPTTIGDDDGVFAFKNDKIQVYFRSGTMRTLLGTTTTSSTLPPTGQWTQLYISYDGVIGRIFRGGIQLGTATLSDTYVFDDGGLGLLIGEETSGSSLYMYDGYMDEMRFRVNPTTNFYTSNFGSTTAAYGGGGIAYTENTLSLFDTSNNIPVLKFVTPGTATAEKSYTFLPGSVTVFGATSTASIGTTTPGLAYGVPNAGAATFDAFNVHSIGEIKAGIKNLEGKENDQKSKLLKMNSKSWHPKVRDVYILDAEAVAKDEYIRKDYTLWESANKNKYISSVEMPGTGTVQVLNSQQMMLDYKAEKELSWASDLKQQELIKETQDILESDETITRLGFMVHDSLTPKEVIEGEAINLMSVIALAVDAIKAQENEIGSLTAALENQKIAYNEEVDNLYGWVKIIVAALIATGGLGGWGTLRTKRKGT